MSDDSTPTWLASWPLLDALSAAQHELRMPLVSMRGALQLIERFCPLDASEMHLPPLLAQVNCLFDQLDNLFELQIRMARGSASSSERYGHLVSAKQPILVLNTQVIQIRKDSAMLHQLVQSARANSTIALTADAQKLYAIFLTGEARWNGLVEEQLDIIVQRLQEIEQ